MEIAPGDARGHLRNHVCSRQKAVVRAVVVMWMAKKVSLRTADFDLNLPVSPLPQTALILIWVILHIHP